MTAWSARAARARVALRDTLRRHRRLLWPAAALLLLCVLSGPLLGAWMRWVELPRLAREADLQPCAGAAGSASPKRAAGTDDASTAAAPTAAASTAAAALDAQEAALAPRDCLGMRRIDAANGLRTAAYRFEDGSLFTLHLRAPPTATSLDDAQRGTATEASASAAADTAIDAPAEPPAAASFAQPADQHVDRRAEPEPVAAAGTGVGVDSDAASADMRPARPAPPPILTASCPVQSRQSLLVLVGLLIVGVVVVLHRLRAGGRFLDFRNVVSEPLRPGEALLLLYAFTLILGTGIGLQIGGCEAADHRDAVKVDRTPASLKALIVPPSR